MPRSSPASAPRLFEPDPSLYVNLWWILVHSLLAAAVVSLEPAMPLTLLGFALVVAHGSMRFPRVPHLVVLNSDGSWAVPDRGGYNLTLAPGTSWTTWYVELVLSGPKKLRIVLLRDQLGTEDWRALQLAVREHGPRVLQ